MRGASLRPVLVPLLACLLIPLGVTSSPAAAHPAAAADDDTAITGLSNEPVLDAPRHGTQAIRQLGDQLDEAAARNDMSTGALRTLLRSDATAWVDTYGSLYFVDPAADPARQPKAAAAAGQIAPLPDTFLLHSNPGRPLTILLDFDGSTVSGTTWNAQSGVTPGDQPAWDPAGDGPAFSDAEKLLVQQVWANVAEDYAPFNVDVTTQDPGQAALVRSSTADTVYGMRVLVTPSEDAWLKICQKNCGGVAYLGVFDQVGGAGQPAWVFPQGTTNNPKSIAEAAAHEAGHTLGLSHDGTSSLGYYTGHGIWAPIMGVGYYHPLGQWSQGSYTGANNQEDDLAILGSYLGLRPDEAPDSIATPAGLPAARAFINTPGDVDAYLLGTCAPSTVIDVLPTGLAPDLDVRAVLYDASGTQQAVSQPVSGVGDGVSASGLGASLTIPATGTGWVLTVDGVGEGSWASDGYDDYGSLGAYTVSASGCDGAAATGTPSAPTSVAGAAAGPGNLTLTWAAPTAEGTSPVTGYVVTRSGSGSSDTVGPDVHSRAFTGLAPGATYQLAVRAVNANGAGPTVMVNAKVAPVAPSVPRNVTGSYVYAGDKLQTVWTEPSTSGGMPITGYAVYVDGSYSGQVPSSWRGILVTREGGFSQGPHTIGIAAVNSVGASPTVTVTIVVPPPDTAAPVLSDFTFTPTSVNIWDGAKQVVVSARVTDQTGTFPPTMLVDSDATTQTAGVGEMALTSGTQSDGVWSKTVTIPAGADLGTWTVIINPLEDTLGHNDATSHPHPTKLTVENATPPDTVAPQLSNFDFTPKSVNIFNGSKQVTVSARVTDQTGTSPPTMVVDSDATAETAGAGPMSLTSGTLQDGTWSRTVTIPATAALGSWTVVIDPLEDTLGHNDGTSHSHPTKLTVTSTAPDTAAPALAGFDFTPNAVNVSDGAKQITVSAHLTDVTGAKAPFMVVDSDSTTQSAGFGSMSLTSGTSQDGIWSRTVTIPPTAAPGTWTVLLYPLEDTLGNSESTFHSHPTKLTVATTAPAAPDAPTGVSATAGDAQALVSWTAPAANGSPITSYTVTSSPGGVTKTVVGDQTSGTVPGLTNGTAYTFTVSATNAVGTSSASAPSSPVTPLAGAAPDAPTGVTATAGNGQALVSWTAPAANGSPVTSYTVLSSPGGLVKTVAGSQTSGTVTGLTNGTAYTFTVWATNAVGTSPASLPSAAVTPAGVPDAPTGVVAVAGNAQVFVSWTAPAANGSPVTGYVVDARVGGVTVHTSAVPAGSTSLTVTGLSNGTTYTFTVSAWNGVGGSPASVPSAAVTPSAPPGPDPACVAAEAHLVTANGTLTQAQKKLTAAKKKLKAAQSAPLSVRAEKVKKAKAKVAAAKKKVKAAQAAVAAAQAAVTAAC